MVDDESNNRQNLRNMLHKFCTEINVMGLAKNIKEAENLINTTSPEVVFLDIEMPGGNGFDLLAKVKVDFKVIFVTAYDEYALKAIKFSALDYLLKPIDRQDLIQAVKRLKEEHLGLDLRLENLKNYLNNQDNKIALSLADEIRLISLQDIIRIQADNNYCKFFLKNKEEILTSKNLGFYYDLLKSQDFIRIHQSHIINKNMLEKYVKREGGYVQLTNGDQIPISRSNRDVVLKLFQ